MTQILTPDLTYASPSQFYDGSKITSPHLSLANITVTNEILDSILSSPLLLSLTCSNCDFSADFNLLQQISDSLTHFSVLNSTFHHQLTFKFCPFLTHLKLVSTQLQQIFLSSVHLKSVILDYNKLTKITSFKLENLSTFSAEANQLSTIDFTSAFPNIKNLNLSANLITTLNFSVLSTPNLQKLNLKNNKISIQQYKNLSQFKNLSYLDFSNPEIESVKVARNLILGEFYARTDEVANAVGTNQFLERFPACASFEKQIFENRKKQSILSISEPEDAGYGVLRLLLRQIFYMNGKGVESEEIERFKEWIVPDCDVLGVGQCQVYE